MKIVHVVFREIGHRTLSFFLSSIAIACAIVCLAGSVGLLRAHRLETGAILESMQEQTRISMKQFEDEIRKSMKGLGFNIYIFPEGQEMSEVYAEGYASKTMPEEFVTRLANSRIVTVNHLLPTLTQKMKWPEQERTIILIGVRGEVPLAHRDPKSPLIDPVDPGKVVLGYELHKGLGLEVGASMDFMGKTFMVSKVHGERGSKDDITIWMNLGECQELLDKKGEINAIQALECNCATVDRLGEIRAELLKILPGTKIIETQSTALARAEARVNAKKLADKELADRRLERDALARELESLMGVLAPLITLFCIGVVSLLAFLNVRDRLSEIGILRAIGVGRGKLVLVFLLRAIFAGLAGGGLALVFVWLAVEVIRMDVLGGYSFGNLYTGSQVGAVLILAPLFAALAAWVPGLFAAQKDPAVVLRYD